MDLPAHWAGTTSPSIAFMVRIGPWMVDRSGIHHEHHSISKSGKIKNRRWKRIFPAPPVKRQ